MIGGIGMNSVQPEGHPDGPEALHTSKEYGLAIVCVVVRSATPYIIVWITWKVKELIYLICTVLEYYWISYIHVLNQNTDINSNMEIFA